MDENPKGRIALMVVGACIAFIALFFPLFTVTYNPPGGSAIVAGHHIYSFVDSIGGWEFANTAAYFRLRPAIMVLFSLAGVAILRLFLPQKVAEYAMLKATGIVTDYLHAFVHIVIAFSWLLVLLLAMIIGVPAMPVSGEAGILPSFQVPPFAPTAVHIVTVEVPHISVSIGLGYFFLLLGVAIGGLAVFKKVVITVIALAVILLISYIVDRAIFQYLIQFLGI